MARLLDDLLDVSRVTRGKIDIRKEVVDLVTLVQDAVEVARPELDDRQHDLQLQLPDEPLYVEGDPSRLLQIQENLLVNAAKYTPPHGQITLRLRREQDEAVLSVEDNGQGIPADMLAAIFDLFVQGQKSLARSEGGMGIGLSLVRLLVELHGGSVWAHSPGRNQGSTFTVRLPLTDKAPISPQVEHNAPLQPLRVLLVEDNDDSRITLQRLLELDGHEVSVASDGYSGYEAIMREKPDVVLLDIGLPGMDGYQIARKVRAEYCEQPVQLIALTGYGRAEDHAAIMKAGFDEHLVKPIDPARLASAIHKHRIPEETT